MNGRTPKAIGLNGERNNGESGNEWPHSKVSPPHSTASSPAKRVRSLRNTRALA